MIMNEWPKVGDCLLVKSSTRPLSVEIKYSWNNTPYIQVKKDGYHLVFDNVIGYNSCVKIIAILAGLHVLQRDYLKIREFRGDMTLRVSATTLLKWMKPAPEPVEYLFNTAQKWRDRMIDGYLDFRRAVLGLSPAAQMVAKIRAHGGSAEGLQN